MKTTNNLKKSTTSTIANDHLLLGGFSLLIASILILLSADYIILSNIGPRFLSITHILILGWISIIVFGAFYQLVPELMKISIFSKKLVNFSTGLLAIGTILLVYSFWNLNIGMSRFVEIGGTLIIVSVLLFIINAFKTFSGAENTTIEVLFIKTSTFWLLLTVLLGIFIIVNSKVQVIAQSNIDLLKIHALWGFGGWLMMFVMGILGKALTSALPEKRYNTQFLKVSYLLSNLGLILLTLSFYLNLNVYINLIFAVLLLIAVFLFLSSHYNIYKEILKRKFDIGMKFFVLAFTFMLISVILGLFSIMKFSLLINFYTQINILYGASLVLGFFTSLILGYSYKIVNLSELKINRILLNVHYVSYLLAVFFLFIGILFKMALLVEVSSVFFIITALILTLLCQQEVAR